MASSARVPPGRVLLVAGLGAFLAFLDSTIVEVAFPSMRASFPESSFGAFSWVLNGYNIAFAALLVVFGRLTDLIGRRRSFVAGTVVFSLASLACGLAPGLGALVVARIGQGIGAALLVPASLALVVSAFGGSTRTRAISTWGATAAVAAGIGPSAGGLLIETGGWRWAFLVNVPIGVATVVMARRQLDESRAPGRRALPDVAGAGLLAAAMGVLTLGIVQGQDWGWSSAATLGCFAAAAALGWFFVTGSRRHPQPLLDPGLLRVRAFRVSSLALFVSGFGYFANGVTNILWLQYVWGYDVVRAGLGLVPGALVAAVTATVVGPLAERWGARPFVVGGALTWAAAFVWYHQEVGPAPEFWAEWMPGQVLSGIGVGAALPLLGSTGLASVPGGQYATASAVASSARQFGGVLGVAVLVALLGDLTPLTAVDALHRGWVLSVIAFTVTAVVAAFLGGTPQVGGDGRAAPHALDRPQVFGPTPPTGWAPVTPGRVRPGAFMPLVDASRRRPDTSTPPVRLPAGGLLFRRGDPSGSAYRVRTGRLEVRVDDELVRELGPGDVVGELALLTDDRRSADVLARRDTTLLEIPRASFDTMTTDPGSARTLMRQLAEQLRTRSEPAPSRPPLRTRVVSVVAMTPGAPAAAVAHVLAAELGRHHSTVVLDRVGQDGLERAEEEHGRVVLLAGGADEGWRQFCLRQADTVVLVAHADRRASAVPSDPTPARQPELVLVGGDPGPAERAAWVALSDAWDVTTADLDLCVGLRPLAMRLAGRAVGLVLGGGGAAGLAHIGVLRELEAEGIHVDRVAGTSVGAIMGAGHALGLDSTQLEAATYLASVRTRTFDDWQLPTHALLRGRRFESAVRQMVGEDSVLEGLPRQLWLVSTDLLAGARHVHRRGPLVDAVLASSRVPGLFAPIATASGELLVDGGVLDNLPVDLLTQRDEGPVVAVNIGTETVRTPRPEGAGPPAVPPLVDTLSLAMSVNSIHSIRVARSHGAWVVCTPRMGTGFLEFHQIDVLVEAGRLAARTLLESCDGDLGVLGEQATARPTDTSPPP
ncbi:DHA2 family efflux MFS transporter permease subunit [Phycicoccus flavus]|uniref:DHA2 family efflux MFS transporter permease subunit n=1 Tax=Phycicoccus flavus TaxID=2502783 RepID=A0A8T6R574_9MICO|nr:DHA2 family efflux MFS transporter permease subunit [Phycicoccus flavus]NHA69629.1 DHA2 family efflux MFS transporter permease subunit [Phycicoccus flavus]